MQKYTLVLSRRNGTDSSALKGLIVRLPEEIVRISGRAQYRLSFSPSHLFIPPYKNNEAQVWSTPVKIDYLPTRYHLRSYQFLPLLPLLDLATRGKQYPCRFLNLAISLPFPIPFLLSSSWHSRRVTVIDHAGLNPREAYVVSQQQLDARSETWLS